MQRYMAGLSHRTSSLYQTATQVSVLRKAAAADAPSVVDYVYSGLTSQDLAYDTDQYPVSGTFQGVMPPWFNSLSSVPANWLWSPVWYEYNPQRTAQVTAENEYIQANVPQQTYNGSTASTLIQQWYTQGMWDLAPTPSSPAPFSADQVAALSTHWIADDLEFARQRLGGANPNVIQQADAQRYQVSSWVQAASNGGQLATLASTLAAAQASGALYVCDYTPVLGNAVKNQLVVKGRYLAAPICFFQVDTTGKQLRPLAIQIQGTDPQSYIFTPNDPSDPDGNAWLLAKLWAASADQQWWFSGSHLFNTHTIDMLFGVAALNQVQQGQLAANHPMLLLAQPFLAQVFDINAVVISAPGSDESGIYQKASGAKPNFCDAVLPTGRVGLYQVVSDLFKNYSFDANAFTAQLSSRGLQQGAIAQLQYPYRDDGLVWWNAIEAFVGNVVKASYANDAAVASDTGLNAWMETTQAAFNHDGTARFSWTPTMAYLQGAFTNLLFTCSTQHTAVNDTMLNGWAFTPNGPFAMQSAPPVDAKSVSQAAVLNALPNPQTTAGLDLIKNQISFVMNGTAIVTPPDTLAQDSGSASGMLKVFPYAAGSAQQQAVSDFWNAIWTGPSSVNGLITQNQSRRVASWSGAQPVPNSLSYYYLSAGLSPWSAPAYLNAPVMNQIQI
ncbi:lipoxygenase family protein [Roseateles sp.]|uniref:lipoxygenase family protein n=1 Tax=Roseateles sp. TaxID=1971397 RepID=UPI0026005CBE|nr:lipoxygenase family protein [Roseateles sp.]